jgi:hypothetical protein
MLTQKRYESDLIRPEIENQSKQYPIDPQINMWCDKDPSNQGTKLELIPSWFDLIFPCLVFCSRNQYVWTIFCCFFYSTDIFWTVTKWNNNFFLYAANSRRRRNWTLRNFCGNNKKQKFQNDITWLMEPRSDTNWCEPRDHTWSHNPYANTPILIKPSKSGLIGV